jgi:hypothetical protein
VSEWLHERGGQRTIWRYPVRSGPLTLLSLPNEQATDCAWRVVGAEGFELAGLPSSLIELSPDATGSLTIARELGDSACATPSELPPAPIEIDPSWTHTRALLHGGESTGSG